MATEAKIKAVEELSDKIKRSTITLSLGYQGMLVQEMEGLRNKLRETNTEVFCICGLNILNSPPIQNHHY